VQKYHPSRVLTIVYQPFAFVTIAILAYNEAKINTRLRNLFGYTVFFFSILALLIVNPVPLSVNSNSSRISI
jgi:equilibrative nucleoside transporter 1/2/3